MIRVTFKCGHGVEIDSYQQKPPICPQCGERQIANVIAPKPTFTGACSGPLVVKR